MPCGSVSIAIVTFNSSRYIRRCLEAALAQEGAPLEVVVADRTMLDNEISAYELNGQRMVTTVLLIKALGGGWKADNAMMTNGVAPLQKTN